MDRSDEIEVIDLGTASIETEGSDIVVFEGIGYNVKLSGISDD